MQVRRSTARFALLACLPLAAWGADWRERRGPTHDGASAERGLALPWGADGPRVLWQAKVGTGFSGIAVAGGRAITVGNRANQDIVTCFDAATGAVLWTHAYPCALGAKYYEGGPNATPAIIGERVVTLSKEGLLLGLALASGERLWSRHLVDQDGMLQPNYGFSQSPRASGGLVALNLGDAGMAFDPASGERRWGGGTVDDGYSSAVPCRLAGREALVLFTRSAVSAVDGASGAPLWRHPWTVKHAIADPLVVGDEIFVTHGYGAGSILLRAGAGPPAVVYATQEFIGTLAAPVVHQGHLYGFHGNKNDPGELRCVEWATGTVRWRNARSGSGTLILADGRLIMLGERGELVVAMAQPSAYGEVCRAQVLGDRNWTEPSLADGRLYVRNARGDLSCIDLRPTP